MTPRPTGRERRRTERKSPPLRRDLDACLRAAVRAVDPERLVRGFLAGGLGPSEPAARVWIAGFGKAAAAMARGAVEAVGNRFEGGVLVVPAGDRESAPGGFEIFEGGHPVPNQAGVAGATAIRKMASEAVSPDLLLTLISGGGSALLTLPPTGVSLEDVQATTNALLRAGADIGELNTVRKHLDLLKGGQLARAAGSTRVLALVLSDVIGDPLDVIASGPVSPDPSTFAMAADVLKGFDLWSSVPVSVIDHLERGLRGEIDDTPVAGNGCFRSTTVEIVGNNVMAAEAARAEAERLGYATELASTTVSGEARRIGGDLAALALEIGEGRHRLGPPACVVSAGETTVTVIGSGKGGRNQEVALAAAIGLAKAVNLPIVVASFGTDGIDGPTDAAGAIATPDTLVRARSLDLDARAALADNDAYPFFEALGDLIVTGPPGTNVMDLQVVLVGAPPNS